MRGISIGQVIIVCIILVLFSKDSEKLKKWYKKFKRYLETTFRKKGI